MGLTGLESGNEASLWRKPESSAVLTQRGRPAALSRRTVAIGVRCGRRGAGLVTRCAPPAGRQVVASMPSRRSRNSCVPCSTIRPASRTMIPSAWTAEETFCETTWVRPWRVSRSAPWMRASVAASRTLVHSSRSNRAGSATRARARTSRWPPEIPVVGREPVRQRRNRC